MLFALLIKISFIETLAVVRFFVFRGIEGYIRGELVRDNDERRFSGDKTENINGEKISKLGIYM